jgi:3-hydroxyisobutyrate dehydrogenase-like beta-hydroxyacid dehydrogenase
MGDGGSGTAAKLVNQLLVGCHATASSEALALADSLNLSLKEDGTLLPLLANSWVNQFII